MTDLETIEELKKRLLITTNALIDACNGNSNRIADLLKKHRYDIKA